ncbi:MAG TPA: hypothetical protein VHE61_19945 [Opitutaceae bacterium]|nr:hypothetical protein [Opitutaceae bacterium]
MPSELPSRVVAAISFVGRSGGTIKTLGGFRKSVHTIPDAANAATNSFLAKICAPELAEEAERLFQEVRTGLDYKRKDVSLSVTSPVATLAARDFNVELTYAVDESDPARYRVTTALRDLGDVELCRSEAFGRIFAGRFSEIEFALKKGARVDAVIDAIEALEGENGLKVDYPSDYRDCVIRVADVDAEVRCTGAELNVVFPRGGAPAELIDAFAAVHSAFQISKVLSGLIGA